MQYSKGKLLQNKVRNHEEAYWIGSNSLSVMSLCIILNSSCSKPMLELANTIENVEINSYTADVPEKFMVPATF